MTHYSREILLNIKVRPFALRMGPRWIRASALWCAVMLGHGSGVVRANEVGLPLLGTALPDPFPLKYRERYARLTISAFQSLDLLGGLEPRSDGFARRSNVDLKEILSEPSGELLLEGRVGERWNLHVRKMLDPDAPYQVGIGGSYALVERRADGEKPVPAGFRGAVVSVGGEVSYMRASDRPAWAAEGGSAVVQVCAGAHMFKRLNVFAGWREQNSVYHLRMRAGPVEGIDRFFMRLGGPLGGIAYEGKYMGISYQGQAAFVGGLSPVVPLQSISFFAQY